MLKLIITATFLFTGLTVTALALPITHPLPLPSLPHPHPDLTVNQGGTGVARNVFATRDESSGGMSVGVVAGIVIGVILGIPLLLFLIARLCKTSHALPDGQGGFHRPHTGSKFPSLYPQPHPYAAHLTPPPPAYSHGAQLQQQQQQFLNPTLAMGHVQMPQTVHLASGGSFYAPSAVQQQYAQEEERGVRFGPVGVRRYGG